MKKKISLLLVLTLLLTLTGCDGIDLSWFASRFRSPSQVEAEQTPVEQTPEEQPETKHIVTEVASEIKDYGLAFQPDYGLHPYNCVSLSNRVIFSFVYEPLFAVTTRFEPVPILAEGYEVSDDGLVTTVTLRKGISFHNGKSLTAADAVYSIESARDSAYYGSRFQALTGTAVIDEQTFTVSTYNAYECVALLLDIPVIPEGSTEQPQPVGTGPFYYEGTDRLVRNPDWWQSGKPLADFPVIQLVSTTTTADIRDQFEYEAVDLVLTDPNSAAYAGFHNDYELWNQTTPVMQYIGYNLSSKVFSNYGLRGAITYAIDRDTIVSELMNGFAQSATLPCCESSGNYDAKLAGTFVYSLPNYHMQLNSAVVEDMDGDGVLDLYVPSLGYAVPVEGKMIVCSSSFQRVQAATQVVNTLNSLGFRLELEALEFSEYQRALKNGNFDLYYGEVRLSNNFDLSPFFSYYGTLNYGSLPDSTMLNLCNLALANSGNSYNLHKRLCERGYITPVLFKSYAVYTTRGAVTDPTRYIDWFLPDLGEGIE